VDKVVKIIIGVTVLFTIDYKLAKRLPFGFFFSSKRSALRMTSRAEPYRPLKALYK